MKASVLSALLFALSASGAVVEKRQGIWGTIGSYLQTKPNSVKQVEPLLRKDAKRTVARWGPFELPALKGAPPSVPGGHGNGMEHMRAVMRDPPKQPKQAGTGPMDPNGFLVSKMIKEGICTDCTVLSGKAEITFEDGSPAGIDNGVYLHHVIVMDIAKKAADFSSWCPGNLSTMSEKDKFHPVKSIFLSGGVEHFTVWYTTPDGQYPSGYYVGNDKMPFALTAEIVNYKPTPQKVFIELNYEWLPGKVGDDALSTLLTVTGCDNGIGGVGYLSDDVQNVKTSKAFPVLQDGTIINARGHLHDGGIEINLLLNDKVVCNSKATYGGASTAMMATNDGKKWETISSMSDCSTPIVVKKGDYLKMSSVYDLEKHPLRESHGEKMEEMGIYTFSFVPKVDKKVKARP